MAQEHRTDRSKAIKDLLEWTDDVARAEIEQALAQLEAQEELTDDQRAAVRAFGRRLSHRLIAAPVTALSRADTVDQATIDQTRSLFDTDQLTDSSDQ